MSTSDPLILGFDTSAAHCAAAVVSGGRVLAHLHEDMTRGQAERLFPLIAEVMKEAGAALADLDALAVGTGPGNFTGLRIAVSAARGLALSLERPAIGIPSHEALAEGLPRPLLVSIDARRERLYLQLFGREARGPEIAALDDVGNGWDAPGLHVTGHAAADIAARTGAVAIEAPAPAPSVALAALRRLAAAPAATDWPRPAPLYLRPADAAPSSEAAPILLP
ncbi:tRNA (adenosine(37)-N6)-threonylcarbamoyltransferase complex dimerization subunit type 1 TsaB [Roseibacterium sp. SDUM158017]|uniref:tRNA (adenosine(37)-N6)-threonylcarbamoyltransferase complex dimerization subunit type 1 TsaB n=1 Tax=Roseicyclus salinarum TaxID=3036773 RepID=UPI0024155A36|nr:tRNA (adenosine(37)-N6)-threonylcarbamoyltransferase complex dimerization subunit type 1 TsaB [Roseibacterium sp. SDUM158017]MDG4647210.1 tRNA (adenosine(37)-N6)-threonylcarbamoyltransferase complex dimerization subunit type 1 TsaB [Roseibacterium sp. SDUM158017]